MAATAGLKRKRTDGGEPPDSRQVKQPKRGNLQRADAVKHALLAHYYPKLQTLRSYVLGKLPSASRLRRKKISSLSLSSGSPAAVQLSRLLDSTLVGSQAESLPPRQLHQRWQRWVTFSQKGDESYVTLSDGVASVGVAQPEVVDFVIWQLFEKEKKTGSWPKHLLADGFRRNAAVRSDGTAAPNPIPGIYVVHVNHRVQSLKESPWPQLLALLGREGERIMIDLLLDCAIFASVEAGRGNYHQLTGLPLFDLEQSDSQASATTLKTAGPAGTDTERKPSEIVFMRSRMLYARAALNARGFVHFGLRHIHVLNRYPLNNHPTGKSPEDLASDNEHSTLRVMMYMFPRQFGLHNVFTSAVDKSQTAQRFQDYTLREEEIAQKFGRKGENKPPIHCPKRLRGPLKHLVRRLQVLHGRCSYTELLRHYCSIEHRARGSTDTSAVNTLAIPTSTRAPNKHTRGRRKSRQIVPQTEQIRFSSLSELATPISRVSAFCQAVLRKIIPVEFWGSGENQLLNRDAFLENIDHFVRLRRFESMNLHELMQGMKISDIEWLAPKGLEKQRMSQTDLRKRKEILAEFLYYLIDSLLIPLIRSNFYVTESNIHRYQLFFFRHDVWRYIAEPAMISLKARMFEEVKLEDALRILDSRQLGFSQIRLLPKESTMRPIMNLRRRTLPKRGKKILGPSINSILGPVHSVLNLEKTVHPERLGSTLFSVGDMYARVKAFKQTLLGESTSPRFYFAKVDVNAAFDTIPQAAVVKLMKTTPSHRHYNLLKHAEIQPNDNGYSVVSDSAPKSTRRWRSWAQAARDPTTFAQRVEKQFGPGKKNTAFVDSVARKPYDVRAILSLMVSHIQQNLVKIGKKYYRQKDGIPQGSILSSILCNYFYADLEREHLAFLQSDDCLLLRLIDDFLLITTDKAKAARFVRTMHGGLPEYGVQVNPSKSLVNFDLSLDGIQVAQVRPGQGFPYCGTRLDCRTLDITKDRTQAKDAVVFNSLTVEFSRHPGQNFRRKVLNAFKIQSHLMFFDTSHNSPETTFRNVHAAFVETATKMWAYARCLPRAKQPRPGLVVHTVKEVVDVAFGLLTSQARKAKYPGYECAISKMQVSWIALHAFRRVLRKKQSGYKEVVAWLEREIAELKDRKDLGLPPAASL